MKQLLFLGFWRGCFSLRAQIPVVGTGPAVTVETNRTHSLVRFVQTVAGNSGHRLRPEASFVLSTTGPDGPLTGERARPGPARRRRPATGATRPPEPEAAAGAAGLAGRHL